MRKRARLARRILREHRRTHKAPYAGAHWEKRPGWRDMETWSNWYCPHCHSAASAFERVDGVPHAYR